MNVIVNINDLQVELREGTADDVPLLLSLIRQMAAFEKLSVSATEESLREALFEDPPAARVVLAFVEGEAIAYATWFFTFAGTVGKRGLWLDDLFVVPAFRGKGSGRAIMTHLAEVAMRHRCARMEWIVLDWNDKAIDFYKRLGASVLPDWRICRLDEAQLPAVAGESPPGRR